LRNKTKTRLVTIFLVIASILLMAVSITAVFALTEQLLKTKLGLNYTAPGKDAVLSFSISEDGQSYTFTGGTPGSDGVIIIPKTYNGLPVTTIADNAFQSNQSVKQVVMQDSVTTIGNNAFSGCRNLTSLIIGENVETIGESAFNVTNIQKIVIPDSVKTIKSNAFNNGQARTLIIGSGVTSIGTDALRSHNLAKIEVSKANQVYHSENNCLIETETKILIRGCANSVIPDDGSVTELGTNSFVSVDGISSINIPGTITKIGNSAFAYSGLISVTLNEGLLEIGNSAFVDCEFMEVTIPTTVTTIRSRAFNATRITTFHIPASVTTFEASVFRGTSTLETITIDSDNPNYYVTGNGLLERETKRLIAGCKNTTLIGGTTAIAYGVFEGHTGLTSVEIPGSVTSIGAYAFYNCTGLTSLSFEDVGNSLSIGSYAFQNCTKLIEVVFPNGLKSLTDQSFNGCKSLTKIEIGSGTTNITADAFAGCNALDYIDVSSENTIFYSENNCLIRISSKGLLVGSNLSVIPNDIKAIGNYAFSGRKSLTEITIPESCTLIYSSAFAGCSALTNVTFENSDGWFVATTSTATSGTDISSTDLQNTETAATLLTSTYVGKYWIHSVSE